MENLEKAETTQLDDVARDSSIKDFRNKVQIFTKLLNERPKAKKIQKHQGYEYLPISVVEKELDKIFFGLVQYKCNSYQQIFNEIACHVTIKVFHPVINQWMEFDGLGSAVIQQDANTKVIDFHQFKKPNALQLTLPKAYAEAIKNAAKKIGKRFGADINRKFEDEYEPLQPIIKNKPVLLLKSENFVSCRKAYLKDKSNLTKILDTYEVSEDILAALTEA